MVIHFLQAIAAVSPATTRKATAFAPLVPHQKGPFDFAALDNPGASLDKSLAISDTFSVDSMDRSQGDKWVS